MTTIRKEERAECLAEIVSEADSYAELSSHYMSPEQVNHVCYPPRGTLHSIYSTAHALVSERHDKSDIARMVYALLVTQSEYLKAAEDRAEAAERERDALAKVAAEVACWNCPLGQNHTCLKLPEPDCSASLLEWARQQARGGEI